MSVVFSLIITVWFPRIILAQTTITSFSPIAAKPGDTVTLTGTNFNTTPASNIVFFGSTKATVTAATNTTLIATVPIGVTYGYITVLNTGTGLIGYSKTNFTPTYNPAKTSITSGDFLPKADFTAGLEAFHVAMGDLDGDGKVDLVVANISANTISVYRNTSTAGSISGSSFAPKVDFATGVRPRAIAIGDLNGDGKPDLAVAINGASTVSVFPNTSTPGTITTASFAAKIDYTTGFNSNPSFIAVGDLDGDGKPDLATANSVSNNVSVLRNSSAGGVLNNLSFTTKVDFAAGTTPTSIAIGDLDGDGKPDLLSANFSSNNISVFRNTATSGTITAASFAPAVNFATASNPFSVAIGDLDGDGKPDLAVANHSSNSVSFYRNTATSGSINSGSFTSKFDLATGTTPTSVAIGDLNGDGKADVAVANSASNTVSVYRSTTTLGVLNNSSFAAKVDFAAGSGTFSVAMGDFDGDARPDLVTANTIANNISVFRQVSNNADLSGLTPSAGTLKPAFLAATTAYTATVTNVTTSITVTPTRAEANATIQVRVNNGSYTAVSSGSPSGSLALNIGSNTVEVLVTAQNTATKTYSIVVTREAPPPPLATITNVTPSTGKPGDVINITGTNFNTTAANNLVYFGTTKATVTAATTNALTVTVPVGATYAPISMVNTANRLTVFSRTNFTPTFSPSKAGLTTADFLPKQDYDANTNLVAIGDLDGDGKTDVVALNKAIATISIFRNTSTNGSMNAGSFAAAVNFATTSVPYSIAIGDMDGDGKPDLAVTNSGSNTVSVFRNTSVPGTINEGSFTTKVDFATGIQPLALAIGDLDGDGKPDLVVGNNWDRTFSVFRNTFTAGSISTASFAPKVDVATDTDAISVSMGDLDGDGKADLAVANHGSNTVSILHNTSAPGSIGAFSFATKVDFAVGTRPNSIASGDVDRDGKADLVIANYFSHSISVLRNTATSGSIGAGSFAAQVALATPASSFPGSVALGDLDGDGRLDIAASNVGTLNVAVFRNISTAGSITEGSFATRIDLPCIGTSSSMAIGDMDGDTKPDLVIANGLNKFSIFRNASNNADLSSLILSTGTLSPAFATADTAYIAVVSNPSTNMTVTPTAADPISTIQVRINGGSFTTVNSGAASPSLSLNVGLNTIEILVTTVDAFTKTYTVTVTRLTPPPPTIGSQSKLTGKPGDAVTFYGTNYNNTTPSANLVFFGATRATVLGATPTELTAIVPVGATYAPVTITNTATGLSAFSKASFTPTYVPAKNGMSVSDFLPGQTFATGSAPWYVAIGDLDVDGKPDVAIINQASSTLSVLRNLSTTGSITAGSFAPKVDFNLNSTLPRALAIGDLDGDGKPELVVANYNAATISIFRNISTSGSLTTSSFASKVDFATNTGPSSVAIGDLDGDGKPEIAVASEAANRVSVFRNTWLTSTLGAGSFAAKVDLVTGSTPVSVGIADFDGDGKPDLAVANNLSNTVSVLRNTASVGTIQESSFAGKVDFAVGTNPNSIFMGDLDGDGKADLATANIESNTLSVLHNTATAGSITSGSFAAGVSLATGTNPSSVAMGDLDGDGKLDVVGTNLNSANLFVFRNIGASGSITTSSFAPRIDFAAGQLPYALAIGDLDGDTKPDLAVVNRNGSTLSVLHNSSNNADLSSLTLSAGSLSPAFTGANTTYTAAVSNPTTQMNITPTVADTNAAIQVRVNAGAYAAVISGSASGNLPLQVGSNTIDILVSAQNASTKTYTITILRAPPPPVITSFSPLTGKPGDTINLTGANYNTTPANNIVFFGATRATVTAATANSVIAIVPVGATCAPITLLNTGNGLATGSFAKFTPTYSPAKAGITASDFLPKVDFASGANPFTIAIGDLDGDGKPDMAVTNFGANTISVYRNIAASGSISSGSFAPKVDFATGASPFGITIGDVDSDGKPDLMVTNGGSNTVSVFRNTATVGTLGTGSFATRVDFASGTQPNSVAIGDVDGDGKADMAVTHASGISLYRNTSTVGAITTGSFAARVDFAAGSSPARVAMADLDGDGKVDVAIANQGSNNVSLLRNTAVSGGIDAGSLAARVDFETSTGAVSVATGDLDGDGKPDLVVTNFASGTVSVFRNTATTGSIDAGSFGAKVDFAAGSNPRGLFICDLDGDGKPDLAVANQSSATVSLFRNTASIGSINSGSFTAKVDFATGVAPYSVSAGDLDGDGRPEIVVANVTSNTLSVIRSTNNNSELSSLTLSSGTLTPGFSGAISAYTATVPNATSSITVTPTRADANATIQVRINAGSFTSVNSGSASGSLPLVVGSNTIEILVTAQDASTKTYTVLVNRAPIPPPISITSISPLMAAPGQAVTLTGTDFNTSPAQNIVFFGATRAQVTAATATSVTVTVPVGATYAPITLLNTGTGLAAYSLQKFTPIYSPAKAGITSTDYSPKQDYTSGANPIAVAIGDLDGDGRADLAVANFGAATVSVYRNTATGGSIDAGSFANKVDFATGTNPYAIAIGDLDRDGKPELVVANEGAGTLSVLRNTGTNGSITTGSFATKVDYNTGFNPRSLAIGDLDGDGKPDMAVANAGSTTLSVFRNVSATGVINNGSFAPKVDFASGSAPVSVAIGDLDGDGRSELVVTNQGSNTVSVFRNTSASGSIGAGSFAAKVDFTTGAAPISVAMGDLDGDGKADLAVANSGAASNTVSVLRNTTTVGSIVAGSFAPKVDFATGTQPIWVAIGDVTGDGKPDLAVANRSSATVSLFRNTATNGSITSGSFDPKQDFSTNSILLAVALGDLDGDAKPDLVAANNNAATISVFRNANVVYSFTGSGNWNNPLNWPGNIVPGPVLGDYVDIVINPTGSGECILNVPVTVPKSSSITVAPGKKFIILGNLTITQ